MNRPRPQKESNEFCTYLGPLLEPLSKCHSSLFLISKYLVITYTYITNSFSTPLWSKAQDDFALSKFLLEIFWRSQIKTNGSRPPHYLAPTLLYTMSIPLFSGLVPLLTLQVAIFLFKSQKRKLHSPLH